MKKVIHLVKAHPIITVALVFGLYLLCKRGSKSKTKTTTASSISGNSSSKPALDSDTTDAVNAVVALGADFIGPKLPGQ